MQISMLIGAVEMDLMLWFFSSYNLLLSFSGVM